MSSYLYPICRPDGPWGPQPADSYCGTRTYGVSNWNDIWTWMTAEETINVSMNFWVYNATQRGTYYFEYNLNGELQKQDTLQLCHPPSTRTFSSSEVQAKYSFTPCGTNEDCYQGQPGTFCVSRNANNTRSLQVIFRDWVFAEGARYNPNVEPLVYWTTPLVVLPEVGVTFDTCMTIPMYLSSGYGCNNQGYDCLGLGGGSPVWSETTAKGYWTYSLGSGWDYSSTWYTANKNSFPCGQCTYCSPVGGSCDDNPPDPDCARGGGQCSNGRWKGCANYGDHDIWQKGNVTIQITKGTKEPTLCDQ